MGPVLHRFDDRQFAVLGIRGIHEKGYQVFWDRVRGNSLWQVISPRENL